MIETAIQITQQAEIFVVVGTSLAVYPAASLLHYTDGTIPKFIVDKKIPITTSVSNLTKLEEPATIGISKLNAILKEQFT